MSIDSKETPKADVPSTITGETSTSLINECDIKIYKLISLCQNIIKTYNKGRTLSDDIRETGDKIEDYKRTYIQTSKAAQYNIFLNFFLRHERLILLEFENWIKGSTPLDDTSFDDVYMDMSLYNNGESKKESKKESKRKGKRDDGKKKALELLRYNLSLVYRLALELKTFFAPKGRETPKNEHFMAGQLELYLLEACTTVCPPESMVHIKDIIKTRTSFHNITVRDNGGNLSTMAGDFMKTLGMDPSNIPGQLNNFDWNKQLASLMNNPTVSNVVSTLASGDPAKIGDVVGGILNGLTPSGVASLRAASSGVATTVPSETPKNSRPRSPVKTPPSSPSPRQLEKPGPRYSE